MATKTTGAEFNRFYTDQKYWNAGVWHEDVVVLVNGNTHEDLTAVPNTADVRISGGIVLGDQWDGDEPSFENYFKRWRKAQTLKTLVVECDESNLDAVIAAIKAAGGRVAK